MRLFLLFLAAALAGCTQPAAETDAPAASFDDLSSASPDVEYIQATGPDADLPFSPAVRVGDLVFLSGSVGNIPGEMQVVEGGVQAEARQAMTNIQTTLRGMGLGMENVVKCTVFIDDISQWSAFNEVYVTFFPGPKPARSAFGADGLALGAALEVECIAHAG